MRGGRPRARACPAADQKDDGLSARGAPQRLEERASVGRVLQIEADHARRRIVEQPSQQIGRPQVGAVAHGDDRAEADSLARPPPQHVE